MRLNKTNTFESEANDFHFVLQFKIIFALPFKLRENTKFSPFVKQKNFYFVKYSAASVQKRVSCTKSSLNIVDINVDDQIEFLLLSSTPVD